MGATCLLPTHPGDLATIPPDRSGTTHIGKSVINHGFIGPGLIGVASSRVAGRLISRIAAGLPGGECRAATSVAADGHRRGIGWVEGWRGEIVVALELGADGRIARCHPHDPSWQNWPALEHAVSGNIVPDFPLINKSFNLSYSGHDL